MDHIIGLQLAKAEADDSRIDRDRSVSGHITEIKNLCPLLIASQGSERMAIVSGENRHLIPSLGKPIRNSLDLDRLSPLSKWG